jgi:transcriptional regulator with PAS, ATPase and Fis domain
MLHMVERTADGPDLQGAYFDGSLELLRELAVTMDLDAALPRLSAIASKMLPHDALRMACFDRSGHPVVNASTAQVPDTTASDRDELIIDDLRAATPAMPTDGLATESVIDAGYRSYLGVSTRDPEPRVHVGFWSKRPFAFNRTQVPLARRIAYHLGLVVCRSKLSKVAHHVDGDRPHRVDASVQRGVDRLKAGTQVRVVGESVEWRDVLRKAAQVAPTETTVLVTGESGTGKEVVARFIHAASVRRAGPFVALNCAALPEQLLEAELFGYERGAFTSAHQSKPGQVEMASGGVLFLDEVSEMSLSAQAKFLRVLQEREFQRLGGTRLLKANIRVIAATNRDLRKAVERGEFREDLFYRLGVFDIQIPPLRVRPCDIVPLSEAFLQELGKSLGRPRLGLTREAHQALLQHDWPGNVRELRNVLERGAIVCEGAVIDVGHLALQPSHKSLRSDTTDLGVVERGMIAKVLEECRGNKTRAARRLGLSRTQLHLRIRKYRLEEAATA